MLKSFARTQRYYHTNCSKCIRGDLCAAPKGWAEKAYSNLIYYNKLNKGGHFAAWEQPKLFSEELRAAFNSLR
jgi:hypothetical protein